jgi:hypothetical protein
MTAPDIEPEGAGRADLQQRVEESHAGRVAISVLVLVILITGVVWNLPDSPLRRSLSPALRPVAMGTGLSQQWALFAPSPNRRLETLEVRVAMADGTERIWTVRPGERVVGSLAWMHWVHLMRRAVVEPAIRPQISHWVVREVTTPAERPVGVQMIMKTQNLSKPSENTGSATATKVLYQEDLAGRR